MKVKVKSKKELEFLEKVFTEVYGTSKDNSTTRWLDGDPSIAFSLAGKIVDVRVTKLARELGDKDGFEYDYMLDNNHGMFMHPSYVEKIVEY